MELKKVPVKFDPETHSYTHLVTGELLHGVTSVIGDKLFPSEYSSVPEAVLKAAAKRGHTIHSAIEMCDSLGVDSPLPECKSYKRIKSENGFKTIENEYIVTDEKMYASCVDLVLADEEDNIILADIKTTYKLNEEYVSWQLSVYAYLFELVNPELKVDRLYAIWLRDEKSELVKVTRHSNEEVTALLFDADFKNEKEVVPDFIIQSANRLRAIANEMKRLKEEEEALKEEVKTFMAVNERKAYKTDNVTFSIRKAATRMTFDTTSFKSEHKELYKQYQKETKTSESIVVKIND